MWTHPSVFLVVEGVVVVVPLAHPPVPAGARGDGGQEVDEGTQQRDGHYNTLQYRYINIYEYLYKSIISIRTHTLLPPGPEPRPEWRWEWRRPQHRRTSLRIRRPNSVSQSLPCCLHSHLSVWPLPSRRVVFINCIKIVFARLHSSLSLFFGLDWFFQISLCVYDHALKHAIQVSAGKCFL